ncbi:MAG: flagellar hook-length control protein FliK [Rhodobacteraceae bacterium]|nr:flagellar hook-length control protein FliK [Paracoccaceae bacterium]
MLPALSSDRQVAISQPDSPPLWVPPRVSFAAVFARLTAEAPAPRAMLQPTAEAGDESLVDITAEAGAEALSAPPDPPESAPDTNVPPELPLTDPPPRGMREKPVSEDTGSEVPDPQPQPDTQPLAPIPIAQTASVVAPAIDGVAATTSDIAPRDITRWGAFAALPEHPVTATAGVDHPPGHPPGDAAPAPLPATGATRIAETQIRPNRVPDPERADPGPSGSLVSDPHAADFLKTAPERTETLLQARLGWDSAASRPVPDARAAATPTVTPEPGQGGRASPGAATALAPHDTAQPPAESLRPTSPRPTSPTPFTAPTISSAAPHAVERQASPDNTPRIVSGLQAEPLKVPVLTGALAPPAPDKAAEALTGAERPAIATAQSPVAAPVVSGPTVSEAKPAADRGQPRADTGPLRTDAPTTLAVPVPLPPASPAPLTPHKAAPGSAGAADTARSVATQIAASIPDRGGFDLALDPQELGRVQLRLIHSDHGSTLFVQADRPETMDLLRRHIGLLEQDLRALGHEQLSLRFGTGGQGQQQQSPPQGWAAPSDTAPAPHHAAATLTETAERSSNPMPLALDRLDLRL